MRIGVGVRLGWEKRLGKLMSQGNCYYKWQNLIADTARRGVLGEEELQWDSYKILSEQLEQEWLQSVEQGIRMQRPKGSKRAPKSSVQRRKISEAIAAKWADPAYRNRVCSGPAKFYGIPDEVERKPRRKPSKDGQSPPKKKDPLASSKLEMLKDIRTQRAAAGNKKCEVVTRAKLLIAEAGKAAAALQIAAKNSPLAQASWLEPECLLLKQNLQASSKLVPHVKEDTSTEIGSPSHVDPRKVNGDQSSWSIDTEAEDMGNDVLPDLLNGNASMSRDIGLL
ncbi:Hypothetical predicted protein [Olea europaea subsp. europaea]|nr:Hypothetical predicted protein [Olea europaea subsp. europaea]